MSTKSSGNKGNSEDLSELKKFVAELRGKVIEMSFKHKVPHLGSSLSCIDILAVLYDRILSINPKDPNNEDRDRFILSKGHAAASLYAILAYKGFFSFKILDTFNTNGSCLAEHPGPFCVPGIEAATGSLGHGLPIGLGMAIAGRLQKKKFRVFVVMSDGECNEGSVWEAAMFASANKLNNVAVIIDYNKWQATGRSQEVMALEPFKQKWDAFGWSTYEVNGHDLNALLSVLRKVPDDSGKPVMVIAHTVKGKGVSFMENNNNWHYRIPTQEEVKKAKKELGLL